MTSLIVKIISIPLVLFIAMYASANVDYGAVWQPITVAIALIAAGLALEYMMLREGNLWSSTFLDFVSSFLIIWLLSNAFNNAQVTFAGALMVSIVITVVEYFLHRHLIGAHKVERTTAGQRS